MNPSGDESVVINRIQNHRISVMQSKIQNLKSKIVGGRRRGRLVRHYFLISAILIGGGLITSGLVEIYFRFQESRDHLNQLQREVTAGAAFKIEQYIQEIERTMKAATKGREITRSGFASEYKSELEKLLVIAPPITEAVAFDVNGVKRAAVARFRAVTLHNKWKPPAQAIFGQAKQGESYYGPVYFLEGTGPYMTIVVPIERFAGEVIGILQAEVDLKYVSQVISGIQVGKAGYAYLVSGSGDLIAHPDIGLVLQIRNLAHLNHVKAAFRPVSGVPKPEALVTHNLQGEKVFASYALIPNLNWAVFTEQPVEEVYAPLYASVLRTSSLLLIGLGMALLASLFVARRVVRPLNSLYQGVERISRGDLYSRLELKTGDEFEHLAEEFNKMTGALREAYTSLEQKVAERTQELMIANQKLDGASRHKSEFLTNVNHELRTPVSAIIGFTRLVLRKTEGQIHESEKEKLQKVLITAEHLLNVINSLLDLAKIEAGRIDLSVESFRAEDLIMAATSTVQPMVKDGRVRLIHEVAPNLPTLNTDRDKLEQIILNLLSNAAKFTEQGEIKISASQQNGSLRLVVSDTGIGIEEGALSHVFEEFHRADTIKMRKYGGTGLGLAIVKKLVNALGGEIGVESEVGKGSTFTVTVPVALGNSTAAEVAKSNRYEQ